MKNLSFSDQSVFLPHVRLKHYPVLRDILNEHFSLINRFVDTYQHVSVIFLDFVKLKFALDWLENQLESNHDVRNRHLSNVLQIVEPRPMREHYSTEIDFDGFLTQINIRHSDSLVICLLIELVHHVEHHWLQLIPH